MKIIDVTADNVEETGFFCIVVDGAVLSHHYLPKKKLNELLDERRI